MPYYYVTASVNKMNEPKEGEGSQLASDYYLPYTQINKKVEANSEREAIEKVVNLFDEE